MIIFIDKDDTLFKGFQSKITDKKIYKIIDQCQRKGMLVGLNSDSNLENLLKVAKKLKLNGPLIAENGAIIALPNNSKDYDIILNVENVYLDSLQKIKKEILSNFRKRKNLLVGGNLNDRFIASNPRIKKHDGIIIGHDSHRRASLMLYIWQKNQKNNILPIDSKNLQAHIEDLEKIINKGEKMKMIVDNVYSVIFLHEINISKHSGIKSIRTLYPEKKIVMIGNSMSDYCGADLHAAVANANKDYIKKANFICRASFTNGVVEFLLALLKMKNHQ